MDTKRAREIMSRVGQALEPLGQELGVAFRVKSGSMALGSVTLKLEVSDVDGSGAVQTPERANFERYQAIHGLPAESLDWQFMHKGELWKVVGYNPGASKMPVVVLRLKTVKLYKFPVATIQAYWRQQKSAA
jgi:hypothetical protein